MQNERTILIVEDNSINRVVLENVLRDSYRILTASDGKEALDILMREGSDISLILLDIEMPVMDGHEFMKNVNADGRYVDIPIIVTTAISSHEDEVQCLEMGASDFLAKPCNPEIVKKRVESMIRLHETSSLLNRVKKDPVTGFYNKNIFIEYVTKRLKDNKDLSYDMICMDIEGYRTLLDRYGNEKCNIVMCDAYKYMESLLPEDVLIGKIGDAQIAVLVESQSCDYYKEIMTTSLKRTKKAMIPSVVIKCGVYQNVNRDLAVETLCINALLALDTICNQYGTYVAFYNELIREKSSKAQLVLDNMDVAIEENQFVAYYQPKYNLLKNRVSGAEALVRWVHPSMGFLNPAEFIPIFEHNGFIQHLDRYMLETVCKDLRKWLDDGKHVVPISINVSQANFDNKYLAEEMESIVDKYQIPHELIHFEITESMDAVDTERKKYTIAKMREKGFDIELDDFGSGYSSMSALSDLPIDVLKIDMSLISSMFEKKHSAVLSGALYTARELALRLVAEGVETKEQVQELKWKGAYIDDISIQGYYFSKPVPVELFEKFLEDPERKIKDDEKSNDELSLEIYRRDNKGGMNHEYEQQTRLDKYRILMEVPGTVLYEYNPYSDQMTVEIQMENGDVRKRTAGKYLEKLPERLWVHSDDIENYIETIRFVSIYGKPRTVVANSIIGHGEYCLCRYHFAAVRDESGVIERVIGRAEQLEESAEAQMQQHMPVGTFRYAAEAPYTFDFISKSLIHMLGFESEEQFREAYHDNFIDFVYEEDRERVLAEIDEQIANDNIDYCEYRVRMADGSLKWLYDRGTLLADEDGNKWFYVAVADLDGYKKVQMKRQKHQEQLVKKYKEGSHMDKMTKLYNHDHSIKLIKERMETKDTGFFMIIDIDDFKKVNDTRGHVVGDQVICALADILKSGFRDKDIIGRYGGDEFICFVNGTSDAQIAAKKAEYLLEKCKSVEIGENQNLSISIGIVTDISKASDVEGLVEMADKALYSIKNSKKGGYAFYGEAIS